jgi:hypothetical protein
MLYTVMPLERIYSYRTESVLGNTGQLEFQNAGDTAVEYRDISLEHGSVRARRDGENFVVEGINSTDMRDYLNEEYVPGAVIKSGK